VQLRFWWRCSGRREDKEIVSPSFQEANVICMRAASGVAIPRQESLVLYRAPTEEHQASVSTEQRSIPRQSLGLYGSPTEHQASVSTEPPSITRQSLGLYGALPSIELSSVIVSTRSLSLLPCLLSGYTSLCRTTRFGYLFFVLARLYAFVGLRWSCRLFALVCYH
jgi:hypothetical protein